MSCIVKKTDGLVQDCSISIPKALKILQSYYQNILTFMIFSPDTLDSSENSDKSENQKNILYRIHIAKMFAKASSLFCTGSPGI